MAGDEGTVAGLLAFLAKAGNDGTLSRSTADAYASAVRQVFEVVGEGWEQAELDPRTLNERFQQFKAARRTQYKETTLQSYKSRLYKSMELYGRSRRGQRAAPRRPTHAQQPRLEPARRPDRPSPPPRPEPRRQAQVIPHQFPLRPGLLITVALPTDLSPTEARRLHAFVDALAMDPAAADR
jgi:hypothetical protein